MSDNDDIEVESDADKRAHHNALERKRRDHIKDSFHSLRDSVPSLQGEKASRAQILDKATEYIQYMRRKNHTHQQDIDDLKRQNALLEQWGCWPGPPPNPPWGLWQRLRNWQTLREGGEGAQRHLCDPAGAMHPLPAS
uniref:Protein max n=1 Tax=Junco hyemalis TaxID=40217 RepID=A0A8C5IV57_JUNHY